MAYGITPADLNNYMRNVPSRKIVPRDIIATPLLTVLRDTINTSRFVGANIQHLITTSRPFTGRAFGPGVAIPLPGTVSYGSVLIPVMEVIANAGVYKQAIDDTTGGTEGSWGPIVERALKMLDEDFNWTLELCCIGDGSGRLARVASITNASPSVVTVDNTYLDFGWENTALLKQGMRVDIVNATDGVIRKETNSTSCAGVYIGNITFGNRANGAATSGTFSTYSDQACTTGINIAAATAGDYPRNGDLVVISTGAAAAAAMNLWKKFPMGLVGLFQPYHATSAVYRDPTVLPDYAGTFQTIGRATETTMQSRFYGAAAGNGVTGFGLASETPVLGTPTSWDLSVISGCIRDVEVGAGAGKVSDLFCSQALAMAIERRKRAESGVTVNITTTTGVAGMPAVGATYAKSFECPDGRIIPIHVVKTIPDNVLYGLTRDDITWYPKTDFDFVRMTGDIWEPARGDTASGGRDTRFEAPFGGRYNIGVERADNAFVILDMRTDI